MSEMLERVALAVFKSYFHPDDAANDALVAEKRLEWAADWRRAERSARAAIEAMREPTLAMKEAALRPTPFDAPFEMVAQRDLALRGALAGWPKMIDAALSD